MSKGLGVSDEAGERSEFPRLILPPELILPQLAKFNRTVQLFFGWQRHRTACLLPPIELSIAVYGNCLADVCNARDVEYLSQRWSWKSLTTAALDFLNELDGERQRKKKPGSDGASYFDQFARRVRPDNYQS